MEESIYVGGSSMSIDTEAIGSLQEYLQCLQPFLHDVDPVKYRDNLNSRETREYIIKFIVSPDIYTIFIDGSVNICNSIESKTSTCTYVAVVKCKDGPLDQYKSIPSQLMLTTGVSGISNNDSDAAASVSKGCLTSLHQFTKHLYTPIIRSSNQKITSGNNVGNSNNESHQTLLKRMRELDLALEQCQRGNMAPIIILSTSVIVDEASKRTNSAVLKGHIEKYNASQVDNLFNEISLSSALGATQEQKEEFANELTKAVKQWPMEIARQTRLVESSFPGSAETEVEFWRDLEHKLSDTKEKLDSPPVLLTKLVLKRTNRVSEQLIREAEVELDRSLDIAQISLSFLKDFPIEEVITATDLHPKLSKTVNTCLVHFSKLKHSKYDFTRALRLIEVLGAAVHEKLLLLIKEAGIMQCSFESLRDLKKDLDEVFSAWKNQYAPQRIVLKDIAKRRNEKLRSLQFDLDSLEKRIASLYEFREQHDRLLDILSVVLPSNEAGVVSELHDAYQLVLRADCDVLDTSMAGNVGWNSTRQLYERILEKVELRITNHLDAELSAAKSADDMFRVFSTFNPLFFRPAIRNAVNAFRAVLLKNVREDVKRLQDKFRFRYDESLERATSDLRDIPPLSGRIIWARQIENQLLMLMKRMEDVLGLGWEDHFEGKQLKEVCDELKNYLDTDKLYSDWLSDQLKSDPLKYNNKLKDFLLTVVDDYKASNQILKVNFDDRQVVTFKEVRYLEWLLPGMTTDHKTIPSTIRTHSAEAYHRYPVAMALHAALNGFSQAGKHITSSNEMLLVAHIQTVRDLIKEAFGGSKKNKRWIKWDSHDLSEWVGHLTSKVFALQERVDDVNDRINKVQYCLDDLKSCRYDRGCFDDVMARLQAVVDDMQVRGFSNIQAWCTNLDKKVEVIVKERLVWACNAWISAFNSTDNGSSDGADGVILDQTVHEIVLSNQILFLSPSLEQARIEWISTFHLHTQVVCMLPRIVGSRFQVFSNSNDEIAKDYSSVLLEIDGDVLRNTVQSIELSLQQAHQYVQQWLQYQALWDASVAYVAEKIGLDIPSWMQLLSEIKVARSMIDTIDEEKVFGPIVINHRQVQSKVNMKYDTWQKELQSKFGSILADAIRVAHSQIAASKSQLESIYLEGMTKDVIIGVEYILKTKNLLPARKKYVSDLETSEKLLQKQRFLFPMDWLSVSHVMSALSDLSQILDRRLVALDTQLPSLHLQIKEEDSSIMARTNDLLLRWESSKPLEGDKVPSEVLSDLALLTVQISKLSEDTLRVRGAKDALGMDFISDDRLAFISQEMADIRESWQAVLPAYDKLQSVSHLLLKDVAAVQIRKQLDEINEELRLLPSKVRSYNSVEFLQDKIAKNLLQQPVLRDVSTDALKERHWKSILSSLNITKNYPSVTLGIFWESNPIAHRKSINDTLATAQGESALEQFFRDIREYWMGCELNLISRDGVRLVAGWDVLFTTLEDNLNSLASSKQSPYFKNVPEFQEDALNWESRLTNLRCIFDLWIEVQRKWVYLRGIFRNPDIKAQLPSQFNKFKSTDNEFVALMKRVSLKPAVMDLLQLDNLARQLERQDSTMTLIQKALGEYLEKQRQIFPRFYFVNNDDLVEIIGNSNEPAKIIAHLSKMFSALMLVETAEAVAKEGGELAQGISMCSKESEVVAFVNPIKITTGVKEWLGALEEEMKLTLASLLQEACNSTPDSNDDLLGWIDRYPAQIVILSSQITWTQQTESHITDRKSDSDSVNVKQFIENRLKSLSQCVLKDMEVALRKKCEQLLTEMVHQRDVSRLVVNSALSSKSDFKWLYHLRFYWAPKEVNLMQKLCIRMSNASFFYGFEYLGIGDRLVQTPLTDRCYLTLTQALHFRMGGNPFGPAGTGKTESVKMLGSQLGRFVLVFNCDSAFDYAAMGRIFAGLCQVGAWGCFDEFNRLEERILSAVSQQILTIQRGLMSQQDTVQLLGNPCRLHKDIGIFVTMNPGYAGRSNLPDNLKQLFRAVAMVVPDRKLIAQVMLFSQGIVTAEELAGKVTLLFTLCEEQLSKQSHYDFGLRALKSVLTGAGDLKRIANNASAVGTGDKINRSINEIEIDVLIKAICDSVLPKLVAEDITLFKSLLQAVFPGTDLPSAYDSMLLTAIKAVCEEDSLEYTPMWVEKIIQLKQVLDMRHGVMMVGPSGTGKSTAWKTLLKALAKVDGIKGEFFVIDPKSIRKDKLYGSLDANTLEWTDGIFTKLLRKVSVGASPSGRGGHLRSWIVFDGDVDPEWAENLNSVLDDNKVLTLPSGDRLKLSSNVRIMMEVDTLKYATLATVSRCGMVWFASTILPLDVVLDQQINSLRNIHNIVTDQSTTVTDVQKLAHQKFIDVISSHFSCQSMVGVALQFSMCQYHIIEPSINRLLTTLHSLLTRGITVAMEYNENNSDFPMSDAHIELFASKWLLYSLLWAFGGSMAWEARHNLSDIIMESSNIELPLKTKLVDLQVNVSDGSWVEWSQLLPKIEIEAHRVTATDVVITTTDTIRHADVLKAWLNSHKPLVLCGPPGSGKTMSLTAVLDSDQDYIFASLNFSSGTTPELILKVFAQFCEVCDSPEGLIMQPNRQLYRKSQWLVVFCDEINLPDTDAYGTQRVIMFMRQLVEQQGYWNSQCKWVHIRQVQFVGACNPPTDAGRKPLSHRFLRHAPVLLVDYPSEASLKQIYRCFTHALLKLHPNLRGSVDQLNNAMVDFFLLNQAHFTPEIAPQYIYSPRELSRWIRAMYEAMEPMDSMTQEELVRLWGHEALRLFQDRLVTQDEKEWCDQQLNTVAKTHFPGIDVKSCLARPLLYSNWIRKNYQSVDKDELKGFVSARLKVFYEEELDVPLVIFDDVLEHVLRIDNVLRHPLGHLLLVGESGVGKTVLTRFVSWMNGLTIFQIKANSRYTLEQFDEDLRGVLRRVGVDGEKICFIFDESNALSSAFLERMNALLASGEVPGLFENDDRSQLLSACRESFLQKEGVMVDSDDEMWKRFTGIVQRHLHVVFTMNPASGDFSNRCLTSPALFNRCVVDWFGTWSQKALVQVSHEFTSNIDTGYTVYTCPDSLQSSSSVALTVMDALNVTHLELHEAIVAAIVNIHNSVKDMAVTMSKSTRHHYLSPRDFLDLIKKFVHNEQEKRQQLEEQQSHIRTGLSKLLETQDQVAILRHEMVEKENALRAKDAEANQKLTQMIEKQSEAEQRKVLAEQLSIELQKQNEEIRIRRESVEQELSEAEPALQAAKHSVQNIRKAQLDEVRALARPPNAVRLTMEMVSIMIGEKNMEWTEIRKVIRREDFIPTVVNFDPLTLTHKQVIEVQEKYLDNPELNHESVDRASKACGPLYEWAFSQVKYATILRKVKPLRDEVSALQEKSNRLEAQQSEAIDQTGVLEVDIKQYKTEYAVAIRDTETIRAEMDVVTKKVSRAEALLLSLVEEEERWQSTSKMFDVQMSTLIGDSLITAAFLTYAGIFDHKVRQLLLNEWSETLHDLGIPYRSDINVIAYLSSPSDHMLWRSQGLPVDDLAIQNAILLDRFHRFPLVIDPSGQAIAFILNKYSSQKMIQTSFLDSSFMKTLASAIRFGNPLLVNDVESIDPVLNPVLNREFQKTGGRTLIRLGSEDIDYSPKFVIILTTRNPSAQFAPDLCSRVTVINFTITSASLESQVLSALLRTERPDVERRRTDVLRLQGEQNAKLRELEEELLNRISAIQGAILDDDTVINSLETIKAEAADLNHEVMKTDGIMSEVKEVSNMYEPLALVITTSYFLLENLADISYLYQFSLQFFLEIVATVLKPMSVAEEAVGTKQDKADHKGAKKRLDELTLCFYTELSRRVLRSLKFDDKLLFVVRLASVVTQGQADKELTEAEADFLTKGIIASQVASDSSYAIVFKESLLPAKHLDDLTAKQLLSLSLLPAFSDLLASLQSRPKEWVAFFDCEDPELLVTNLIPAHGTMTPERLALLKVVVIKALRPERTLVALELYVMCAFGSSFKWRECCKLDLKSLVEMDSKHTSPIMICSEAGQDMSSKVDTLASSMGKMLLQVAMGSAEGYSEADRCIAQASKAGSWVLLRNVHLCPEWLGVLEKKFHNMASQDNFRLFLTCEMSSDIPSSLLRISEVVIAEASAGMKANMQRFFATIPASRIDRQPSERCRLYGLLAWFHAIVQERLRYAPLGWTKKYEFSEADAACALDVIDQWIDEMAGSRAHVNPEDIPWQALRTLLSESLYGGRIDRPYDQAALDSFIVAIFNAKSYAASASLMTDQNGVSLLNLPDSLSKQAFEAWIASLPDSNSPAWLGLPATAESQLRSVTAQRLLSNLASLQGRYAFDGSRGSGTADKKESALKGMHDLVDNWLKNVLPTESSMSGSPSLDAAASEVKLSPLQRCLAREIAAGKAILSHVRSDLELVKSYSNGSTKAVNGIRELVSCFASSRIPTEWRSKYVVSNELSLGLWMKDLSQRLNNLSRYTAFIESTSFDYKSSPLHCWLGRIFSPTTFITATRQQAAQLNHWSLEDLELYLEISQASCKSAQDTIVEGLMIEGAVWDDVKHEVVLSDSILSSQLPMSRLRWRRSDDRPSGLKFLSFPVYLNDSRTDVAADVLLHVSPSIADSVWFQRGVCFTLQSLRA